MLGESCVRKKKPYGTYFALIPLGLQYLYEALCTNCLGKSTLACTVGRELHSKGNLSYILDGDNLRHGLNKDLGFKAEDRTENIRRVGKYVFVGHE